MDGLRTPEQVAVVEQAEPLEPQQYALTPVRRHSSLDEERYVLRVRSATARPPVYWRC